MNSQSARLDEPFRCEFYMHTIANEPAYFSESDGQIVYANHGESRTGGVTLARSLRQIRREQQRTIANRLSWKMKDPPGKYGYVRVRLP